MLRRTLTATTTTTPLTRGRRLLMATLTLGVFTGLAAADASRAATLAPHSAAAYRDSVGVQMHADFTGYAYDTESAATLGGLLAQLGVAHVRDSACVSGGQRCSDAQAKLAGLRGALGDGAPGVDLLLLTTTELATSADRATRDAQIERALRAAASPQLRPMVAGLEAVNEPDLKGTAGWEQLAAGDEATTDALLARPEFATLQGVRRLSPAMGRSANTDLLLGGGWRPRAGQRANFHPYPPAWGGPEHALQLECGAGTVVDCARRLSGDGGAPIASESGYSTTGGMFSTSWVSERAQATYLPRLLLENFDRGIARTYLYELIDLDPAGTSVSHGYGLWRARRTATGIGVGSPKPAAAAVARLQRMVGDLGAPAPQLRPLEIDVTVDGHQADDSELRRTLLQRADGSYVLALWQPKSVFSNVVFQQRDLSVADRDVTVSTTGSWDLTARRPTRGDEAVAAAGAASSVTVPVGADVTLIELRAPGGGHALPPTTQPAPSATPTPAGGEGLPTPTAPQTSTQQQIDAAAQQLAAALQATIVMPPAATPTAPRLPTLRLTPSTRPTAAELRRSAARADAKTRSARRAKRRARAQARRCAKLERRAEQSGRATDARKAERCAKRAERTRAGATRKSRAAREARAALKAARAQADS